MPLRRFLLATLFMLVAHASAASAAQFVDLSAGGRSTCGTTAQGQLFCWGDGREGQLGRVGANAARHPRRVIGIYDAQQVSAGTDYGCTVLDRGSQINVKGIYACWGNGTSGQLGTGTFDRAQYPQQVRAPDGFTRVAAGNATTCGIGPGGGVWCWGDGGVGQLGEGAVLARSAVPVQAPGLSGITDLTVGARHACAVRSDAQLFCWGSTFNGRTGQPTIPEVAPVNFPTPVPGMTDVLDVAAGTEHTCALRHDRTVWCFGVNSRGQLGANVPVGAASFTGIPTQVPNLGNVVAVAAGGLSTCALIAGGTVQCWGDGHDGKLGNSSRADSSLPVPVAGLTDAMKITVGANHACALTSTGAAFCWGANRYGQLGNGDVSGLSARSVTPARVVDFDLGRLTFVPRALMSFPTGTSGGVIEARAKVLRKTSSRYSCPRRGTIRISAAGKVAVRKVSFTRRSSTSCRVTGSFGLPAKTEKATVARYSIRGTHLRTSSGRLKAQRTT